MGVFEFILALVFIVIVLPTWLVLRAMTKWRQQRSFSGEEEQTLAELWQSARRMEERIGTLETILDAESPDWRSRHP